MFFESILKIGHLLELRRFTVPFRSSDHWSRFGLQNFFDDLLFPDFESFLDRIHHVIPRLPTVPGHD